MSTKRILALLVISMWLIGCSGLNEFVPVNGPIPKGRSIVFGNISLGFSASNWLGRSRGWANLINTSTSMIILHYPIKQSGEPFYWYLPPGHYAFLDFEEAILSNHVRSYRIYAEFSIDSEQTIVYVGTLGLASPLSSPSITDDYETAVQKFHTTFPALESIPIEKQILRLEEQR